ncbi:hypothetical protein RN001_014842 [Aquatica leii]|uniref:Amino acid transporter transmembrane domain-containing protein n=1 Tax=Aquatica leii TaxID=1421715 RepID=A0AAN7P122_9COLE|nr:hypothetical protein RN001_014842 [Aquatica leii]
MFILILLYVGMGFLGYWRYGEETLSSITLNLGSKDFYHSESKSNDTASNYDPYEHRNVSHPTTNVETFIHMLKGFLGTGILAMPEAFKMAGLANGFILTILIGILCTYSLHVLVQAQYVLCKKTRVPFLTYSGLTKAALLNGPIAFNKFAVMSSYLVDVFLILYEMGMCCVYSIFVSVNVKQLVDEYLLEPMALEFYTIILLVPFMLILSIPNLKWLAPFSFVSNLLTFGSFGIILYYVFSELPLIENRRLVGTLHEFPLFFGTTLFALEGVGVVTALENNMKTPKSFGGYFGVLNVAMFFMMLLYVGMGFLGYWRYGEETQSSITLNLENKDVLAKLVLGLNSIAIYLSYGLQGFVPVNIMWNTYLLKRLSNLKHVWMFEYILRIVVVIVTVLLGLFIPLLGPCISLVGAFCLSALGIVFPAIIDICVKWPNDLGYKYWILIKDILLVVVGILGLLSGSYSSIAQIVQKLSIEDYS